MTQEQLAEIEQIWAGEAEHRCPECNARPHREADVIALLAEVRRLNRMVDRAIKVIADGMCCPSSKWTMTQERNCWSDSDGCEAHWRKYLESEVADNG